MQRALFLPLLLIIVASGLYSQVIIPQFEVVKLKNDQIERINEIFADGENIQRTRDELIRTLNTIDPGIRNTVENAVPIVQYSAYSQFLVDFSLLLSTSSIPQDAVITTGTIFQNTAKGQVIMPVSVSMQVTFGSLTRLIENILQWSRGVRIVSMDITQPGGEDGALRVRLQLEALFSTIQQI